MSFSRRSFLATSTTAVLGAATSAVAKSTPTLGVGVIGHTGRGDYGHGIDKVWLQVSGTRIVAVADPVESGRLKAIERLKRGELIGYENYREMLDEMQPAFVAIGPRHVDQHADMAVAAAESGAKGIYIEKPFCRDLAEADAIVAACEKNGTKLAIAHRNRYHPVLPAIRKLVEEGAIGTPLEIRARGKEDRRGGGLDLWVLGSHLLNLVHYFAGEPVACSATVAKDGRPAEPGDVFEGDEGVGPLAGNEVHARFEMESGIPVFFDSIQNAGTREAGFGIQLIGNAGIIDLRADREPLAHLWSGNPNQPSTDPMAWRPITSAGVGQPEPVEDIRDLVGGHLAPVRDLIEAIGEDRDPLCSATDGRVVVAMTMAVFESHRQGGARVRFPLERQDHPFLDW